jgi:hydrogenase nickel incorporation protein HypA/HybF
MHELGITRNIVEIAEQHARQQSVSRVTSVRIEIGALSGVIPEAVEFAFEACTQGTLLEDAQLIIDRIAGRGRCDDCGRESEMDRYTFACPYCESFGMRTVQGEELRIIEMEVD